LCKRLGICKNVKRKSNWKEKMKRYEKLCKNPLELAEYITKKLEIAV
jgi:hypothetical protein